jgi:hypothetical protein
MATRRWPLLGIVATALASCVPNEPCRDGAALLESTEVEQGIVVGAFWASDDPVLPFSFAQDCGFSASRLELRRVAVPIEDEAEIPLAWASSELLETIALSDSAPTSRELQSGQYLLCEGRVEPVLTNFACIPVDVMADSVVAVRRVFVGGTAYFDATFPDGERDIWQHTFALNAWVDVCLEVALEEDRCTGTPPANTSSATAECVRHATYPPACGPDPADPALGEYYACIQDEGACVAGEWLTGNCGFPEHCEP